MKKIMMCVAAAICAVAAQAASINWSSGVIYPEGSTTKVGTGAVTGYLYIIDSTTYGNLDFSTSAGASAAYATYKAKTADVTGASAKTGAVTLQTKDLANGETQYAVIIYEMGDPVNWIITKGYDTINTLGQQANIMSTGMYNSSNSSGWQSGVSPDPSGTPEPTSGLLMMIGLGCLALRRRVHK